MVTDERYGKNEDFNRLKEKSYPYTLKTVMGTEPRPENVQKTLTHVDFVRIPMRGHILWRFTDKPLMDEFKFHYKTYLKE